jgi:methionyl-tRNA synthetase
MTSKDYKRYTITAALPYANGPVHIGHIAGCYLPADTYVRYLKLKGKDVLFICGSDEHGVPITISARKEGVTPQQVVDKYHHLMKKAFDDFGIDFTFYGRTSSATHHKTAQDFFTQLFEKGMLEEKQTEQYFDPEANQFLADRYIIGTCPKCSNENAYGDQCEKCGTSLSPEELINPKSTLSGATPIKKLTSNWFLPLDKLQPKIEQYLSQHEDWKTNVLGQCKSWLQSGEGLQPRSMTRDLDWGIPVPLENAKGKVLYVWFDAPIGYISNTIEHFNFISSLEGGGQEGAWKKYWQNEDTRLIHFIGKDNIVFHCIIFPAMLMEHGAFITADNVPANEFLNLEGDKISTSRNHAVWLHEYLGEFPDKQDELRYVLTSIAPENKDADFTWKDFQARVNNELVAILGNLVNRVMVLTEKYFQGKVPEATGCSDLEKFITEQHEKITKSLEEFRFREALSEIMNVARHGNQLLSEKEPWKLIKTDEKQTGIILYDCLQIIGNLGILMQPFLPNTSKKIFDMLQLNIEDFSWTDVGRQDLLTSGHQIGKAILLFQKIEDDIIEKQIAKLIKEPVTAQEVKAVLPLPKAEQEGVKSETQYEDFAKIDLRVGKILSAEKIEKADKLLKLIVDLGFEQRTIVSGIAEHFKPEEIIGKQVTVVANLAPRKLRGIESKGMILMAENSEGKLQFVNPDSHNFQLGAIVK